MHTGRYEMKNSKDDQKVYGRDEAYTQELTVCTLDELLPVYEPAKMSERVFQLLIRNPELCREWFSLVPRELH